MTDGEAMHEWKSRVGRVEKKLEELSLQLSGLVKDVGHMKEGFDRQAPLFSSMQAEIIALRSERHHAPSPMQAVKDWLHIIALVVACVSGVGAGLTYVIRNAGNEQAASISLVEAQEPAQSKPPAFVVISGKKYRVSY